MASSSTSSYGPVTTTGTVTSYLPLTTAFSAPAVCSSLFLHPSDPSGSISLFLNSPQYQYVVNGAPDCLPPEISPWWYQTLNTASPTVTSLGGYTFECPEAYTTVYSVNQDTTTTIGCCPSQYTFGGTLQAAAQPLQCTSTHPAGTITYVQAPTTGSDYTTTSIFVSTPTPVWGVQVNGYIFDSAPTNSAAVTSSFTTSTGSSQTSSSIATTTSTTAQKSSGLSEGAKVGVGVGVSLGVVGLASLLATFLLFRRRRNKHSIATPETAVYPKPELDSRSAVPVHEMNQEPPNYEVAPSQNHRPSPVEIG